MKKYFERLYRNSELMNDPNCVSYLIFGLLNLMCVGVYALNPEEVVYRVSAVVLCVVSCVCGVVLFIDND